MNKLDAVQNSLRLGIPKLSVAIASAALSSVAIAARPVHAAPVTYDFTVNVTKGALAGKSFNGTFSYDDATLKKIGIEELGVAQGLTACMNFFGRNYRETDDSNYPTLPKLIFENGKIKQLDFWIEPNKRINWWKLPGWEVKLSKRATAGVANCPKPSPARVTPNSRDNRSSWRAVEGVLSKDKLYDDLRKFLITSGWRPAVTPEECKEGVGGGDPAKICDRRPEVEACSGGIRQCKMRFEHQESRVKLTIFTKAFPEGDKVTDWDILPTKSN